MAIKLQRGETQSPARSPTTMGSILVRTGQSTAFTTPEPWKFTVRWHLWVQCRVECRQPGDGVPYQLAQTAITVSLALLIVAVRASMLVMDLCLISTSREKPHIGMSPQAFPRMAHVLLLTGMVLDSCVWTRGELFFELLLE